MQGAKTILPVLWLASLSFLLLGASECVKGPSIKYIGRDQQNLTAMTRQSSQVDRINMYDKGISQSLALKKAHSQGKVCNQHKPMKQVAFKKQDNPLNLPKNKLIEGYNNLSPLGKWMVIVCLSSVALVSFCSLLLAWAFRLEQRGQMRGNRKYLPRYFYTNGSYRSKFPSDRPNVV